MTNKERAIDFLKLAGFGNVQSAYDKYVDDRFIHHNQYFAGDRQSLLNAMADAHITHPNKIFEVKYVYVDGATVITHSLVQKEDMDIAVVHIFRFENDKIVELWDLGQALEKTSPNINGAF